VRPEKAFEGGKWKVIVPTSIRKRRRTSDCRGQAGKEEENEEPRTCESCTKEGCPKKEREELNSVTLSEKG